MWNVCQWDNISPETKRQGCKQPVTTRPSMAFNNKPNLYHSLIYKPHRHEKMWKKLNEDTNNLCLKYMADSNYEQPLNERLLILTLKSFFKDPRLWINSNISYCRPHF